MIVVFHPKYMVVYASDPAAAPGRMEAILREIRSLHVLLSLNKHAKRI